MKFNDLLQIILFFGVGIALTPVLGRFLARVFQGDKTFLHPLLFPVEKLVYRLTGVDPDEEMSWLKYMWSVVAMTSVGFASLMVILMTQKWLPLNTQGLDNLSWHLAFNTAWSFTCNADWQSYSGEAVMTYLSQTIGLVSLVCEAVGYMHGRGIIHRDLKPSNIMICRDRTLRVMDYGLASRPIRRRSPLAKLTPIFGTPEYMAPEQVRNGSIDERTDVYALGAILYELLTGEVPFKNEDPWQSAFQRTTGDPIAPRVLNPAISPQAEEIVLHALQRKPGDRYPSMAAFQADLGAPALVPVTGCCNRLQRPRWKLGLQSTPVLSGLLLGLGAILSLVALFFVLRARFAGR